MTKKERVIAAIRGQETDVAPCGFSLHFPKEEAYGDRAVEAHLRFFEETDTDILKIMNENLVPYMGEINQGSDYRLVGEMTMEDPFMKAQTQLTEKILKRCDRDAFILGTLHGVTASAIHPLEKMDPSASYDQVREKLCRLLREPHFSEGLLNGNEILLLFFLGKFQNLIQLPSAPIPFFTLGLDILFIEAKESHFP